MDLKEKDMSDLIKNIYNHESLHKLALDIQSVYNPFQVDEFLNSTMNKTWDDLELKDRVYHIGMTMGKYLPTDYSAAISVIDKQENIIPEPIRLRLLSMAWSGAS